ncbi:uncharacterized protein LOC134286032 [Aedes albopictus]|uniref:Endonuclease n=1 Tax=Aedes albopictus TaxID=7160 RepID=A0ABM1ZUC3_AEDAL
MLMHTPAKSDKMAELKTLVHLRGQAKAKVTRIRKSIEDVSAAGVVQFTLAQLKVYSRNLEAHFQEYLSFHHQITALLPAEKLDDNDATYLQFENHHTETAMMVETLIQSATPQSPPTNVSAPANSAQLPPQIVVQQQPLPVPIPSFDGKPENWPRFQQVFSDIMSRSRDSNAVKLHHLERALSGGSAAKLIDPKTLSDGNFKHAWELLLDVYEDERKAVDSHIHGLLSLKRMTKECSKQMRELLNEVTRHVEGLRLLNQDLEGVSERFVVVVLSDAFDPETRKQWETTIPHKQIPSYEDTVLFLKERCSLLERCEASHPKPSSVKESSQKSNPKLSSKSPPVKSFAMATPVANSEATCEICSASHPNYKCERFVALTVPQRRTKVRELFLCFNCLRKGHISSKCPSNKSCQECQGRHNTLLHEPKVPKPESKPIVDNPMPNPEPAKVVVSSQVPNPVESVASVSNPVQKVPRSDDTLLLTAMVDVLDSHGNSFPCRAFLDCGSQPHLVSSSFVERLGIDQVPTHVEVVGATGKRSVLDRKATLSFRSRCKDYQARIECLVTDVVTGPLPGRKMNCRSWNIPSGLSLADPTFHTPGEVQLLIGVKLFFDLMLPGHLVLGQNLPILKETRLGWVVAGGAEDMDENQHCYTASLRPLTEYIEKFWSVESVENSSVVSKEEQDCEQLFSSSTIRNPDGTYTVYLPLKESVSELGSNRYLALKRFHILEHRFSKNPELKKAYVDFINEYKSLSHCKQISESDDNPGKLVHYLPHHAVLKPSSSTTRLRVVFDASARTTGPSLNDVLMIGPTVQDELFCIILRFRKHRFAITADISKMYRRIRVVENHSGLQRIFWRENPDDPLQILELTTVTYGTSSAPFLATRSLLQLARDECKRFPIASKVVEEDVYIDDVVSGADTIEQAVQLRSDLTDMLNSGGFPVHKWCASDAAILDTVPEEDREKYLVFKDSDVNKVIKTLGLLWDPEEDEFRFHCKLPFQPLSVPTKRIVLSEIARLFDPLGLVAPVIVLAKIIMQQLWKDKVGWDDPLTGENLQSWLTFRESLKYVDSVKIPRFVGLVSVESVEVHGFADASLRAYGAVIYLRVVSGSDVKVSLLCSKSRIAPLSPLTIPRLELCAALLLSRLVPKCVGSLKMEIQRICLWSDSNIVLAWLKRLPNDVFVRNRVMEINSATQGFIWSYVRSEDNPADVVSRGQLPQTLASNSLWWNGPTFLKLPQYEVLIPDPLPESEMPDDTPIVPIVSVTVVSPDVPFLEAFGSFRKLQRVIAYVLRFANNCRVRHADRVLSKHLTVPELRKSMMTIIGVVQRLELSDEINLISSGKHSRRLGPLDPILVDGLLRVGGRLENSHLPYEARHQVLLPNKSPVCELLIRDMHLENLHLGPSGLMSLMRQRFWLINAKSTIRKVLRRCVTCFRSRPRCLQPMMGRLPEARVVPSAPFSRTGVDFAGPVFVKVGLRKFVRVKAYICIFVCLATKAIHLELVSDLSSAAFVAALHRFVSRRGLVEEIHSDHGTNFAGAKSDLHELFLMFRDDQSKGRIDEFCSAREIVWKFIPPRSPNFGGLWEAGVKSTKTHLRKVLSNACLTFEEFCTVLTQIEAVLNSRPLFTNSLDTHEPSALTPGHFLIGRALVAIPEPTLEDVPVNRLTRWKYLQSLRQHFWKRWSNEYLNTLQARSKWHNGTPNVTPGLIVIIKEDNLPPQSWKLGRIVKVYPGKDLVVRVVDVETSTGVYRRSVSRLAPLPIEDNDQALASTDPQ